MTKASLRAGGALRSAVGRQIGLLLLLAVGVAAVGAMAQRASGAGEPKGRFDRYGDPLPARAVTRLGALRFRHEGEAGSLVFAPDGKTLAGRIAQEVVLWDARSGKELRRWSVMGRLDIDRLIDFSPDGRLVAAIHDVDHIGLWDPGTGKVVRTIALPEVRRIEGPDFGTIRFSSDGKYLAVGGCSHSYLIDVAAGKPLHHFKDLLSTLIFSPDSKTLVTAVSGRRGVCRLRVRDVRTAKVLREIEGHPHFIRALAFAPDGKTLASGGNDLIVLWDEAGKVRQRIEKKMGQVTNLAFTPDGKTLVAGGEGGGKVHVWDLATGAERWVLDARTWVRSMALSPDGKTVAAGTVHSTIRLWDLATGRERFTEHQGHDARINAIAYSPDGRLLATGGENKQVWLWDAATGRPVRELRGTDSRQLVISPDGRRLASLSPGRFFTAKTIEVRDLVTGKEVFRLSPEARYQFSALAFAPDGKTLVSAEWKHADKWQKVVGALSVWDAATGRSLRRFLLPGMHPECLALAPDGTTLAVGLRAEPQPIRLWDLRRGEEILALSGPERAVFAIAFSPDGRALVSGDSDGVVRLWELATGKEVFAFRGHRGQVTSVAFAPGSRVVASAEESPRGPRSGRGPNRIWLWDAATGRGLGYLEGHHSQVTSLAFSPDGSRLASGLHNSTGLVWEVPHLGGGPRRALTQTALEALWSDLGSGDARKGRLTIGTLVAASGPAVRFLQGRLRPARPPTPDHVARLLADLDGNSFAVRRAATAELEALGEQAAGALRRALAGKPSLEVRKRLEELLARTKALPGGDVLRGVRAVAVLEHIGSEEARRLLGELARGAADARLTREAKVALRRLGRP